MSSGSVSAELFTEENQENIIIYIVVIGKLDYFGTYQEQIMMYKYY